MWFCAKWRVSICRRVKKSQHDWDDWRSYGNIQKRIGKRGEEEGRAQEYTITLLE